MSVQDLEIERAAEAVRSAAPYWEWGHELVGDAVALAASLWAQREPVLPATRAGDHPLEYANDLAHSLECESENWRTRSPHYECDVRAGEEMGVVAGELRDAIAAAAASGAYPVPDACGKDDAPRSGPPRRASGREREALLAEQARQNEAHRIAAEPLQPWELEMLGDQAGGEA